MQKTFDKKKFLSQNSIWLVLIAMVIIMGVAQPSFFTVKASVFSVFSVLSVFLFPISDHLSNSS